MKKLLTLVLGSFLGCMPALYYVETTNDEFDNYTVDRMHRNYLGGQSIWGGGTVQLNVQRFRPAGGPVSYQLIVEYRSSDWLFIEDGESLILLIDGERVGFTGDGSRQHRNVVHGVE